jgi:hypothetical protein
MWAAVYLCNRLPRQSSHNNAARETMRTFLVCVDGSACGNYAFHESLKLVQPEDLLLLCHCVQDVYLSNSGFIGRAPLNLVNLKPVQQSTDAAGRQLLEWYIAKAKRLGHTNVKAVLGVTNTEGYVPVSLSVLLNGCCREFICRIAKQRNVDYIVIGRRGLSGFKRFFSGSTSSQVMEQADANVIVVHEDWPYKAQLSAEPATEYKGTVHGEVSISSKYLRRFPSSDLPRCSSRTTLRSYLKNWRVSAATRRRRLFTQRTSWSTKNTS